MQERAPKQNDSQNQRSIDGFTPPMDDPLPVLLVEDNPINMGELEDFYSFEQLRQMLTLFVAATEDMLKRIEVFMKEHNKRAVQGLAHEIKASCASIGAKQLARLCLFMEQAVGQDDWIEAEESFASLKKSFGHFCRYVEAVIDSDQVNKT